MANYAFKSWDEPIYIPPGKRSQKFDPKDRIPFARLAPGSNIIRLITSPIEYRVAKVPDPEKKAKFGIRVRCSELSYSRDTYKSDPTYLAGNKSQIRMYAGIIHRKVDGAVACLLDMNSILCENLETLRSEVGSPLQYDINIKNNPDSSTPAGRYTPIHRAPAPLSEADLELIEKAGGIKNFEETMIRLVTPPSVEKVHARMIELGWDGVTVDMSKKPEKEELVEVADANYDFNQPSV